MAETPVCRPKLGPSERLVNTHCDPPAHGDSRNVPTDCLFVLGKEADENQIMRTDTNGGVIIRRGEMKMKQKILLEQQQKPPVHGNYVIYGWL